MQTAFDRSANAEWSFKACEAGTLGWDIDQRGWTGEALERWINLQMKAPSSLRLSLLATAALAGDARAVDILSPFFDMSERTSNGGLTPLMWAACGASAECCAILLSSGSDPHATDYSGGVSPKPIFFRDRCPERPRLVHRDRPAKAAPNCCARFSSSVCR
jgi:hypothetical protein